MRGGKNQMATLSVWRDEEIAEVCEPGRSTEGRREAAFTFEECLGVSA